MKTSGYFYILVAVAVGFILANAIMVPVKEKLTTQIVVSNSDELKGVIDTLKVDSFEVKKEAGSITISYLQTDNNKNGLMIMIQVLASLVIIALVLWVIRFIINRRYN
ncbi:MAG: hypothetical protein ACK5MK_06465 [Dysgonomonas sp.]